MNILTAAGITQINEPIFPQNGERIFGKSGVVTFNQASQYSEEENPNDPITPPDCPNCGGGINPEPQPQPSGNCEKKNISELKQILDDYTNQSFCDKEFPEVQFSTFIGYDKPPSDSTAKEIELRMLCPEDDCVNPNFVLLTLSNKIECSGSSLCPDSCIKDEYEFKVEFFETQEYFRERLDSVFVNAYQPCFYKSTFWTNDFMVTFYVCRTSSYQPNKQCDNGNFCYDGYSYVGFCETFQIYGVNEIRVQDGKNLNNKSKDEIIQAVTNGMMSKNGVNCITVKS